MFADVIDRLRRLGAGGRRRANRPPYRVPADDRLGAGSDPRLRRSAQEHVVTSDIQRALETGATAFPKSHLLADRQEGRYLASVEQDGKWFAVSKVVLTACLARGRDAVIAGVPASLVDRLRLTCPGLVTIQSADGLDDQISGRNGDLPRHRIKDTEPTEQRS